MLLGLDLSHWRTVRSFDQMRAAGVRYVYTKATEGDRWHDVTFPTYWAGLQRAGIYRGAFHYYLPGYDAVQQARQFYRVVSDNGRASMLPPAADFEEDGASPEHFAMFLRECESLFGVRPLIYTSTRFWFNPAPAWTRDYLLWVASWYGRAPALPAGWASWKFWQYSNLGDGRAMGLVESTVDVNWFAGVDSDLIDLIYQPGSSQPAAPTVARARNVLNLRAAPWGAEVGQARAGSTWAIERIANDGEGRPWFYVNERACLAGWLCDVI